MQWSKCWTCNDIKMNYVYIILEFSWHLGCHTWVGGGTRVIERCLGWTGGARQTAASACTQIFIKIKTGYMLLIRLRQQQLFKTNGLRVANRPCQQPSQVSKSNSAAITTICVFVKKNRHSFVMNLWRFCENFND